LFGIRHQVFQSSWIIQETRNEPFCRFVSRFLDHDQFGNCLGLSPVQTLAVRSNLHCGCLPTNLLHNNLPDRCYCSSCSNDTLGQLSRCERMLPDQMCQDNLFGANLPAGSGDLLPYGLPDCSGICRELLPATL